MLRLIVLTAVFVAFWMVGDGSSFYSMVDERGIGHEMNPLIVWAYDIDPMLPLTIKFASTLLILFAAFTNYEAGNRKTAYAILILGALAGVIGTWSNGGFS